MNSAHKSRRVLGLVGCLVMWTSACADEQVAQSGGDMPDMPLVQTCLPGDSPEFAEIGPTDGAFPFSLGPCGHLLVLPDAAQPDRWSLINTDGTIASLPPQTIDYHQFSPGGGLLVTRGDGKLVLRDLRSGTSTTTVAPVDETYFGFVGSDVSELREQMWQCSNGSLQLVEVDASHSLMSGVECDSITGTNGAPRLLFADSLGRVTVADTDRRVTWSAGITDFDAEPINGPLRSDDLSLSHDGSLGIHEVIHKDLYDPPGEWVEARVIAIDSGEQIETCTTAYWQGARIQHAPTFVQCDDRLLLWQAGELTLVSQGVGTVRAAATEGSLFFGRGHDPIELMRIPADAPTSPELLGSFSTDSYNLRVNENGDAAVVVRSVIHCAGLDSCTQVSRLNRWSRGAGMEELPWLFRYIDQLILFDDGAILLWAVLADESLAEPHMLLIGADGELEFDAQLTGEQTLNGAAVLPDERVVFGSNEQPGEADASGSLVTFDRATLEFTSLLDADRIHQAYARDGRVAASVNIDGTTVLYWGTAPGL